MDMVLPPIAHVSDGTVVRSWLDLDARIPVPIRDDLDDHEPRVAAHSPYIDDRCLDGRHLFDIIESASWHELELPDGDGGDKYVEQAEFRARLTCVRCGKVDQWEGTRTERHLGRLTVEPLTVGDLVAQHVAGTIDPGWRDSAAGRSTGQPVGVMDWGCTTRGRYYHVARLDAWPAGQSVEAPTPIAALRKVTQARAAVTTEVSGGC